jgi:hypothetical protein
MLDRIVRSYTMERKRIVHDRQFRGRTDRLIPTVTPAAAPTEYEDVFF